MQQSTDCRVRKVCVALVFPEDFGGHVSSGPASPWSAREVRELEGKGGLAGTDQKRPVGILTNLLQVQSKLFVHWPCLITCGDELHYNGQLPISCPCVPQHDPFRGTDELADFVSSSSQSPGKQFWKLCVAGVIDFSQLSLRDGDFLVDATLPSTGFFSVSRAVFTRGPAYFLTGSMAC